MRNSELRAKFPMLLLFTVPVAVIGHASSPPPMERSTSAHLGQESKKRLVRLLTDFSKMEHGHGADDVQQVIDTLRGQKAVTEVKPDLTRTLVGWLKAYKNADAFYALDASRLLIDLGDMEEINSIIVKLHSSRWQERFEAKRCVGSTLQPLVIRALEKDLLTEDGLRPVRLGAEFLFDAPSEFATKLITEILVASPAFADDVKNWAEDLRSLKTRKHRELIRLWWKENARFFDSMSYDRVAPLSPDKYTLCPEDFKPGQGPREKVK